MTLYDQIASILAPALDARAPYAKQMIAEIESLIRREAHGSETPAREQELRQMFAFGISVAKSYGDNAFHLEGEQLERQFQRALIRLKPSAASGGVPAPETKNGKSV